MEGAVGPKGERGVPGDSGYEGLPGESGEIGRPGPRGLDGPPGEKLVPLNIHFTLRRDPICVHNQPSD